MINETDIWVKIFRSGVLALAIFFFFLPLFEGAFISFFTRGRYLTNWSLYCSLIAAAVMWARSFGWGVRRYDGFIGATIVLNILVVFLYWKLYFEDPALVNDDGPLVWWKEYYLHLGLQILMWLDAFLIFGAYQKIRPTILWLLGFIAAYVILLEVIVHPLSSSPIGSVTNGLPYPFLNDMVLNERFLFYGTTVLTAFIFLGLTLGLQLFINRSSRA